MTIQTCSILHFLFEQPGIVYLNDIASFALIRVLGDRCRSPHPARSMGIPTYEPIRAPL